MRLRSMQSYRKKLRQKLENFLIEVRKQLSAHKLLKTYKFP